MSVANTPAPEIAIRANPPSPKRLSRKVLLLLTCGAGAVVAFALISGLSRGPVRSGGADQTAVAAPGGPPDTIQQAPSGYDASDLPRARLDTQGADLDASPPNARANELAPPQDPMLQNNPAQQTSAVAQSNTPPHADPEQAARTSPILFSAHANAAPGNANTGASNDDRLDSRLQPPRSRYEIQAGQVIPAALVTALNSDIPGRVIAQVTAPVYDSVTGDILLIPQGARLIGTYQNNVRYGDSRIVLAWNRLILPNGWSIDLKSMQASDPSGAAGLTDRTDNHFGRLAGAIGLSAVISVVANQSENDHNTNSLTQSVGDAAAQQAAQTGSQITQRELSVHPTLVVREGAPVRVLVTADIELRPYQSLVRP